MASNKKKKKKQPLLSIRIRKVSNAYLVERDADYDTIGETLFFDEYELGQYIIDNAPLLKTRTEADAD